MPSPKSTRRFEFKSDRSYKFWEVTVDEFTVTTRYGRIGTQGRSTTKDFDSTYQARAHAIKEAEKKKKAGYVEYIKQVIKRKSNDELWEELKPHEPFLESILESPDDEDHYMVYADWLLEQDDPRGQFILSQIAAADSRTPMWEQTEQEQLVSKLRIKHWRDWLGELVPLLQQEGFLFEFHRGIISSFQFPWINSKLASLLKSSPHCRFLRSFKLLSTQPPELDDDEEQEVSREVDTGLEPLLGADFSNLRSLCLISNLHRQTRLPGLKTFEVIHSMPRLTSLAINASFEPDHYQYLFDKEMPNLVELVIEDRIGNEPIEALCNSGWMEQLVSLKLVCDLQSDIAPRLAESLNPNVMERIDVNSNSIDEEGLNTIEKTGVSIDWVFLS